MLIFYIFIFILGTAIGSFLNVVIARLKSQESIFKNRSHCPFCNKKLNWQELVPILSFIVQGGKCKNCKERISWQYPLVEFFTGLSFLLIFIYQLPIFIYLITCFLIILFVYDLKHYLVPDKIIYPAILVAGIWYLVSSIQNTSYQLLNTILAVLIGGGFFLIIVLISKGKWMGIGDIKIGILMGLLLGWDLLFVALFLAFLIGAIVSIVLLILKKKSLKSEIPFGPFLTGATFITLLWGDILIKQYLDLFV